MKLVRRGESPGAMVAELSPLRADGAGYPGGLAIDNGKTKALQPTPHLHLSALTAISCGRACLSYLHSIALQTTVYYSASRLTSAQASSLPLSHSQTKGSGFSAHRYNVNSRATRLGHSTRLNRLHPS